MNPEKVYQPLGCCAYCGSVENLSSEHIIPFGLGGGLIFPKSSCGQCQKATCKVEDFVLRQYLCPLRSYLALPSRKPAQRPKEYKLKLTDGYHTWSQKVKLCDHPGIIKFIAFDPPGRVAGRPEQQANFNVRLVEAKIFSDWEERLRRLNARSAQDQVIMNAMNIARMIAKIAHSFAIAELGFEAFENTFVNHLIKDSSSDWNYWVGGCHVEYEIDTSKLHRIKFLRRGNELSVIVHLFAQYCPNDAYEVIVGRLKPEWSIRSNLMIF